MQARSRMKMNFVDRLLKFWNLQVSVVLIHVNIGLKGVLGKFVHLL